MGVNSAHFWVRPISEKHIRNAEYGVGLLFGPFPEWTVYELSSLHASFVCWALLPPNFQDIGVLRRDVLGFRMPCVKITATCIVEFGNGHNIWPL